MSSRDAVVIWAEFLTRPGADTTLLDFLAATAARARSEPGCIDYRLYRSPSSGGRLCILETWSDMGALNAHRGQDYVKSFKAQVAPLLAQPYAVTVLEPVAR